DAARRLARNARGAHREAEVAGRAVAVRQAARHRAVGVDVARARTDAHEIGRRVALVAGRTAGALGADLPGELRRRLHAREHLLARVRRPRLALAEHRAVVVGAAAEHAALPVHAGEAL